MTVKSFLTIPNRKIPAVGKASYGRDFLFEQKSRENFGCFKNKAVTFAHVNWLNFIAWWKCGVLVNFNTDNLDYNGSYESDLAKLT